VKTNEYIPKFVTFVIVGLGCIDLIRGVMHTVAVGYAAQNIAGLDLSGPTAYDQLQLMVVFGISNFISGIALILIGLSNRKLSLALLGVIPTAYFIGVQSLKYYGAAYEPTQANWGGSTLMMIYLSISALTFLAGLVLTQVRKRKAKGA
jgi:hypothetical protein